MEETVKPRTRWDIWLPAVAIIAAAGMIALAAMATNALEGRQAMVVEGSLLTVSHRIEMDLRDLGIEEAESVLAERLLESGGVVVYAALLSADGGELVTVGERPAGSSAHRSNIFVGRAGWRSGPPLGVAGPGNRAHNSAPGVGAPGVGGQGVGAPGVRARGRLWLDLYSSEEKISPPPVALALLPATLVLASALVALALLGGRLLVRQQEELQRLEQRRHMESLGRAGAGLAHQLRTPLATIKGSCQLLTERLDESNDSGFGRRLETIIVQTQRMEDMLANLLDYARPPDPQPSDIRLATMLTEICSEYDSAICVEIPDCLLHVDHEHFRHILTILVNNALQANLNGDQDNQIEITARQVGAKVEIAVSDRGQGPGDDPERLFEPYVTTRAGGTGLGLPIARTLTEANGGYLILKPRAGGGCIAELSLQGLEV